ncbi:hypothetical protein [Sphingomonas sp.]|uniref:hypothetical protein n=1 Tax=Sphingomonas sp. TaxID=28214 RepID=UPI002B9C58BE|nr:hypothetical protein [Sphingomonas sp.]HWK34731.1 hypothetical protein [Sphingomonas sp.]
MRTAAALLLIGSATLGACKPAPVTESVLANEAAEQKAAAALTGWDRLFNAPRTTIPAVNQYGFQAGDYAGLPGGAESKGRSITISSSLAKAPNHADFAATGRDAAAIDTLAFAASITDPDNAATAKTRFGTLIRDFLFSAKADGAETIQQAIDAEQDAQGTLPGAAWTLKVQPIDGAANNRVITVTFTRPDIQSATSKS